MTFTEKKRKEEYIVMRLYLALEKPLYMLRNVCFIVPIEDLFILIYLNYIHLILLENIIAKNVYFREKNS